MAERSTQIIELTSEIPFTGVTFDPKEIALVGVYKDELSAHRAKRVWVETLETNFLLDSDNDFETMVGRVNEEQFALRCAFLSACARYAFWRLTNNQAPEAQYLIETAHIPHAESLHEELLQVPDLHPISELLEASRDGSRPSTSESGWLSKLRSWFRA